MSFDFKKKFEELCREYNLNELQLLECTQLTADALNSPTIDELSRLCEVFGITLSDFFAKEHSAEQKEFVSLYKKLTPKSQRIIADLIHCFAEKRKS